MHIVIDTLGIRAGDIYKAFPKLRDYVIPRRYLVILSTDKYFWSPFSDHIFSYLATPEQFDEIALLFQSTDVTTIIEYLNQ